MRTVQIRNVIIFILSALLSGWIGYVIDIQIGPQPEEETLGMGIWLVLPLVTVLLLILMGREGWQDIGLRPKIKENINWYTVAFFIFPVVTLAVVFLGRLLGWIDTSNFNSQAYFSVFAATLLPNFIKNIFEELVWRGYLTSKLIKLNIKDNWIYLIVGFVWSAWHIPYYLFFLPESVITQVLPTDRIVLVLVAIVTMTAWTVMFVELYRITKSIWPVVILHMVEDSVINHLIFDQHIVIASGKEILISPITGLSTTILYLIIGFVLREVRIRQSVSSAL